MASTKRKVAKRPANRKPKGGASPREQTSPTRQPVPPVPTITVPLTLPLNLYAKVLVMGEYDGDADFSACVADSMDGDVESWLEAPDKPAPARFLRRWLKAHPLASLQPGVPPTCLEPWDYPDELLLVVCDWHHKERQAVEQAIYVEVGKHLASLNVREMRQQPIYSFFENDSTLGSLPAWQQDYLRYERDRNEG